MPQNGQTPKERVYTHDRYYKRGVPGPGKGRVREWTQQERDAITAPDRPADAVLSVQLDRSIGAIQVQRCYCRKTDE